MLAVAEHHGLNEFVLRADKALEDVSKVSPPLQAMARLDLDAQSRGLVEVTNSLSRMRAHAGL